MSSNDKRDSNPGRRYRDARRLISIAKILLFVGCTVFWLIATLLGGALGFILAPAVGVPFCKWINELLISWEVDMKMGDRQRAK